MPWRVLSAVLGQPVPYWPFPLRIPELIQAWRPGIVAVAAARPVLDICPMLRLASAMEEGSPAQRTLVNFAQTVQSRATDDATSDLRILHEVIRPGTTVVAATPLEVRDVDRDDLDESVRHPAGLKSSHVETTLLRFVLAS